MTKRRYKGIEIVNVGLSWYLAPHDPCNGVSGRYLGNSFAAAKRTLDTYGVAAEPPFRSFL